MTVWWRCSRSARSIDLIDSGKEKREKWKKKKKTFNVAGHARAHDADVARRPDETQSREYVDLDVSGHAGGAGSGSGGRGGGGCAFIDPPLSFLLGCCSFQLCGV